MQGVQREDSEALSQLYDRYNGIIKALILRVVHNEAEADDLLQEIFMEIWNQAKNFSAQKGKPLGESGQLSFRKSCDGRLRQSQCILRRHRAQVRPVRCAFPVRQERQSRGLKFSPRINLTWRRH